MTVAGVFSLSDSDSPIIEVEREDGTKANLDLWEFYDFCLKAEAGGEFSVSMAAWLNEKLGTNFRTHHALKLYYYAMDVADGIAKAEREIEEQKKAESSTAS